MRVLRTTILGLVVLLYVSCSVANPPLEPVEPTTPLIRAALTLSKAADGVGIYQTTVLRAHQEGWLSREQAMNLLTPMLGVNELIIKGDGLLRALDAAEPPYDMAEVQNILNNILALLQPTGFMPDTHREGLMEVLVEVRATILNVQQIAELANASQ